MINDEKPQDDYLHRNYIDRALNYQEFIACLLLI